MGKKYLLDTDIVVELLRRNTQIIDHIKAVKMQNCYISEITVAELYFGAAKSGKFEHHAKDVDTIMSKFKVIPIFECLPLYGKLRWQLQSEGMTIGDFDILIGATSIAKQMVMVTGNVSHFDRLPNIQLENWKKKADY